MKRIMMKGRKMKKKRRKNRTLVSKKEIKREEARMVLHRKIKMSRMFMEDLKTL